MVKNRSFYLHYECGALLYNVNTVPEMKNDFLATQGESKLVTREEVMNGTNAIKRLGHAILRLISPMM